MVPSRSNPVHRGLLCLGLLLGLGACAQGAGEPGVAATASQAAAVEPPMTAEQYRSVQVMLRRDPQVGSALKRGCAGTMARATSDEVLGLAVLLDVPSSEAPQVVCERIVAAMKEGRLSYADYVGMRQASKDEAIVRRMVRILRDPALSPTI